jgi:acetyl esterase/lipase
VVLFSSEVDLAVDPADDLVDELIARVGAVVLTVSATHTVEAHAAVSWAADHAAELGADTARIALVGHDAGAAVAERVAELAVDEGWPPLRHVALIWPHDDPATALDDLTRALAAADPHRPTRSAR